MERTGIALSRCAVWDGTHRMLLWCEACEAVHVGTQRISGALRAMSCAQCRKGNGTRVTTSRRHKSDHSLARVTPHNGGACLRCVHSAMGQRLGLSILLRFSSRTESAFQHGQLEDKANLSGRLAARLARASKALPLAPLGVFGRCSGRGSRQVLGSISYGDFQPRAPSPIAAGIRRGIDFALS